MRPVPARLGREFADELWCPNPKYERGRAFEVFRSFARDAEEASRVSYVRGRKKGLLIDAVGCAVASLVSFLVVLAL